MKSQGDFIIVGPGAIGTALGLKLSLAGYGCSFWGREGPMEKSISIVDGQKHYQITCPKINARNLFSIKGAFFAVKAYDLDFALKTVIPYLGPKTTVIAASNGAIEPMVRKFSQNHPDFYWRIGVATFGVSQLDDDLYRITSKSGNFLFGPLTKSAKIRQWESELIGRSPFFRWNAEALAIARKKWLFNTVINSLAAAYKLKRNGDLLRRLDELERGFEEAYRLGENVFGPWPWPKERLRAELLELVRDTEDNENSMARDVRLGRPTESPYLAGLAQGQEEDFPALSRLHARIMGF